MKATENVEQGDGDVAHVNVPEAPKSLKRKRPLEEDLVAFVFLVSENSDVINPTATEG